MSPEPLRRLSVLFFSLFPFPFFLLLGVEPAGLWDWTRPYSLPRIAAYIGIAALVGAFLASRFSPKSNPAPEGEDLLDNLPQEPSEKGFDRSVRQDGWPKALETGTSVPGQNGPAPRQAEASLKPEPDLTDQVVWSEREDVYRPAPVEARRFVETLSLPKMPEIKPGQAAIFIRQQALVQIQTHLKSDLKHEQGGLLVGQAFRDVALSVYLLLIEEALPAHGAVETETTIEYTADSWQALTPRLQQMDAAWTILGSYHSHPGHGVFLSATDRDTQGEIYSQDWQVALVVDPVADKMGFFVGEKGTPCPNWYVLP